MAKDIGDLIIGVYNWGIQDKIIHDGAVLKSPFVVGETITGTTSGATATINYVGTRYFRYTLLTLLQFQVNETVTGATSGASCSIWKLNQFHTTIGDKLYFQEAPEQDVNELFPFTVFMVTGNVPYYYFQSGLRNSNVYEKFLITFYTYSNLSSSTQITLLDKQLGDIYEGAELSLSNWSFKYCKRNGLSSMRRDDNKIWQCISSFDVVIQ